MRIETIKRRISDWKARRNRRRILVLEDLNAGYIPVYKVASTSLRNLICRRQAEHFYPQWQDLKLSTLKKRVERKIRRSMGVWRTRRFGQQHFLFAFVRNPITRLYSCYLDKVVRTGKQGKRCSLCGYGIETDIDFENFVRTIAEIPDSAADKHFRSQYFQIYHRGEWLVDFLGKFENLDKDWQRLADKIGIDESPEIYRSTGAGSELDSLPLSLEAARKIARRYQKDIDLLGYRKDVDAWLERKAAGEV